MTRPQSHSLSRRERQIMDVLHRLQRATAATVRTELPSPPSYSAVRALLRILEEKGHVRHIVEGPRYVYEPVAALEAERESAMRHLVRTFFDGSTQDAVVALLRDRPIDLMIVLGGYNSSNTANLAKICAVSHPTYHIADPDCLLSPDEIRHRPIGAKAEVTVRDWLPLSGPLNVGLTSGASTPDNLVGAAVGKLAAFCTNR